MTRRRLVGTALGLGGAVVSLLLAGCTDEPAEPGTTTGPAPSAPARTGPSPTAAGDPPVVQLLDAGAEPRTTLRLAPDDGATATSAVRLDQRLTRDGSPVVVPSVTMTVETTVADVTDGAIGLAQGFADVDASGTGTSTALTTALGLLDGATGRVDLASDGVVADAALDLPGDVARTTRTTLEGLRDQVLSVEPVFPTAEVGEGASWSVVSVVRVDGVEADQTATYTLEALDGDAYVVGVTTTQDYRTGVVGDVAVTRGTATATGRIEGVLTEPAPRRATSSVTATIGYEVAGAVTEVGSSVRLDLTTS